MAVFGCGPIGLMAIGVGKACGVSRVVAVDINDYKLRYCQEDEGGSYYPTAETCHRWKRLWIYTHGKGVDIVLEMSGASVVFDQIFKVVRPGGRFLYWVCLPRHYRWISLMILL